MGNFFSKLVGIIYVTDQDPDIVRISHMTFWGTRKDEIYMKSDIIPFSELPDNISDTYINLKTYSDPANSLHLTIKHGTIYDAERFYDIFGHDPDLIIKKKDN
jgi:hypothetical protein